MNYLEHIKETKPDYDIEEKMEETYKDAAVSITITSLTNILSFAIGMLVPSFKTVTIFCAFTAAGLAFVYILTLTVFGPCIILFNKLDKNEEKNEYQIPQSESTTIEDAKQEAEPLRLESSKAQVAGDRECRPR